MNPWKWTELVGGAPTTPPATGAQEQGGVLGNQDTHGFCMWGASSTMTAHFWPENWSWLIQKWNFSCVSGYI